MTKLSEVIKELRQLKREHGDIPVTHSNMNWGITDYPLPINTNVKYKKVLKGRENVQRTRNNRDLEELKGEKIGVL